MSSCKKVKFSDDVIIFYVPKYDDCRFIDRETLERKMDFERRVLSLDQMLKPIHKIKLACYKQKSDLNHYLAQLKDSLNRPLDDSQDFEGYPDSEESDEEYGSEGEVSEEENSEDDFEIVFE